MKTSKELIERRILEALQEKIPEAKLELYSAVKTNGICKNSISIRLPENNVSPILPLDEAVERILAGQTTIEECVQELYSTYQEVYSVQTVEKFQDAAKNLLPENLEICVINTEANKTLLEGIPYREIADNLALIARYRFDENSTCMVTKLLLPSLNLAEGEMLDIAIKNSISKGYTISNMTELLSIMMGMSVETVRQTTGNVPDMYVITNPAALYGAAGIFISETLRKEVYEKLGGSYYILPSSIHECIAVSTDCGNREEFLNMVCQINAAEVAPEEVLSNSVYLVDDSFQIRCVEDKEEEMDLD